MGKVLIDSVRPVTAGDTSSMPEAATFKKNTAFVIGLYHTYFHRNPDSAELSHALEQLASGLSRNALKREFKNAASNNRSQASDSSFVQGLYATIAGRPPTSVGQAYWIGLLNSGLSRQHIRQMFQASNGMLPPPILTWANPAATVYGTPLGSDQLNATASVPGTFTYSPPAGTVLDAGYDQPLSVVFTPADAADYPSVSASI
jgi:hypothetical protein